MKHAIQYIDTAATEAQATEMLDGLRSQGDFICGRVLAETNINPRRIQAFFTDAPEHIEFLPDGCRRVVLLPGRWPLR